MTKTTQLREPSYRASGFIELFGSTSQKPAACIMLLFSASAQRYISCYVKLPNA